MSVYPISITKITLHSERNGSDKEYHLCLIHTADGRSLLIKRYGKRGTWGSMDFVQGDRDKTNKELNRLYREKTGKGYQETQRGGGDSEDFKAFQDKLGSAYFFKLGDHLPYLIPGADTTGQKQGEKVEWVEGADGKFRPKEKPGKHVGPPPPPEEVYAGNALWGAF